ncbi:MAG: NAD(P)/FAD-dependent oxidoreductase, partial [Acholeplasmataceae bacterium]|nr:NAD(P)/FAD-dependent oxidoreductase [Acholeplasmataceae bacterium]
MTENLNLENNLYDVIIIGAGPSGLFAGTLAAMNQLKACIIESSSEYGGQLTLYREKAVYDMPGFSKILAGDLVNSLYQQYLGYEDKVPL